MLHFDARTKMITFHGGVLLEGDLVVIRKKLAISTRYQSERLESIMGRDSRWTSFRIPAPCTEKGSEANRGGNEGVMSVGSSSGRAL